MKLKFKFAGITLKLNWKKPPFLKKGFFKSEGYTLRPAVYVDPEVLRKKKIYRIFKEKHCEFFPGNPYGDNGTQPSCYIYYYKLGKDKGLKKHLIGELMYGESLDDFFKRKEILIKEDIKSYMVVQNEIELASFDKLWVEKQGQYQ